MLRRWFLVWVVCLGLVASIEAKLEDLLSKMTLEEKIGQLFMVPACPMRDEAHKQELLSLMNRYHIGGVIVKASEPDQQIALLNELQERSKIPLLVSIDAEWGLGMRMPKTISFPRNLTLGAIVDDDLLYELGCEIGRECKAVGAHINLAPVLDVNTNPKNSIIHTRSFGENPQKVAAKGKKMILGLQSEGVYACAKHFPGHGDTEVDSHEDLPFLSHDLKRLHLVDFFPFKEAIDASVACVMTAHLVVPSLSGDKIPAPFSSQVIRVLRNTLGFSNLVMTDALNMKALSLYKSPEEIAVFSYSAGHDILLYGDHIAPNVDRILKEDVPKAYEALRRAFLSEMLNENELDQRVLKILTAKEKLGLFSRSKVVPNPSLHSEEAYRLKKQLFYSSITAVKNEGVLPLLKSKRDAFYLRIGNVEEDAFEKKLQSQIDLRPYDGSGVIDRDSAVVVLGVFLDPSQKELDEENYKRIERLQKNLSTIVVLFGSPYALKCFDKSSGIIVAYEKDLDAQLGAAAVVLGTFQPKGKLPITASDRYPLGIGITLEDCSEDGLEIKKL